MPQVGPKWNIYAGDNICCNYASFKALLPLCRWYFLLQLFWWIILLQSCKLMFLLQLSSYNFLQHLVTVSASNMYCIVFKYIIVFMQVGVSVAVMQVVPSAMHSCFYCKMLVTVSVIAM